MDALNLQPPLQTVRNLQEIAAHSNSDRGIGFILAQTLLRPSSIEPAGA